MLSSKAANKEINRTHKRALRVLHKNNNLSFDKCLMKEAGIKIHVKNLYKLMLEVFKTLNCSNPSYLWDLFNVNQVEYNLKTEKLVVLPRIKTQTYEVNSITCRGSILSNALTNDIKAFTYMAAFKKQIIGWKGKVSTVNYVDEVLFFSYLLLFIFIARVL